MNAENSADITGLIYLVVAAVALLVGAWRAIRYWVMRHNSAGWPTSFGTVLSAETRLLKLDRRRVWVVFVAYSFKTADGSYYGSQAYFSLGSESACDQFAPKLKDMPVEVRYRPNDPDESFLKLADGQIGERYSPGQQEDFV